MRRARLSILLFVAVTAVSLHAQRIGPPELNRRGAAVDRLHVWVESVRQHRPGIADEAVARIARWTPAEIDDLWIELRILLVLMDEPGNSSFYVDIRGRRGQVSSRVVYTGSELTRLRRLALDLHGRDPQVRRTPDYDRQIAEARNRVLKRGAAMHTTIALTHPRDVQDGQVNPFASNRPWSVLFSDGRQVGVDRAANHWTFARMLLGRVTPAPSSDDAVRRWYQASGAALLRDLQLNPDHFDDALRLFPDDARLLLLAGSLHETLASPSLQALLKSASLPIATTFSIGSARAELGRAEPLLRRAVSIDPHDAEARIRLGRILSLQGRHAEALTELKQVNQSAPGLLQYYASLFTGDAAEALGRLDEAHVAYTRAASLYPRAQAPRFALSQLIAGAGDLRAAGDALDRALSDASEPTPDDDPHWTYHVAVGRDADALLVKAYRALYAETAP